jgi:anti-sigma B factor antagonist
MQVDVEMQVQVDVEVQVDIEEINHVLVITPRFCSLDAEVAQAFRDHVAPRIHGRRLVVFALGNIEFMDSSGLGSLVALYKKLPAGGVVRLAEVSIALQTVLRLTRLDTMLQSYPTVALAVALALE